MSHGIIVHVMKYSGIGFDPEYQIEGSDLKHYADRARARRAGEEVKPKISPGDGIDYLSKEEFGELHAAGFIRTAASRRSGGGFDHFESLSNKEKRTRILRAWKVHSNRFPKTKKDHHRLVFSMSKEFHDKLVAKGINPQAVLHQCMKRTMRNFTDQFHKGDSLGYTYGFHHDTDNLHAHVFVHPRTQGGQFVSFSGQLKNKIDNGQEDKLNFLKESLATQLRFWEKKIEDPHVQERVQKHAQGHRFVFAPRPPRIRPSPTIGPGTPRWNEFKSQQKVILAKYQQIKAIETEIKSERRIRVKNSIKKQAMRFMGYRPTSLEKAVSKAAQQITLDSIRQKQMERFRKIKELKRQIKDVRTSQNQFQPINPVVHQQIRKQAHGTRPEHENHAASQNLSGTERIFPSFKARRN